jgi:hypothetical protein
MTGITKNHPEEDGEKYADERRRIERGVTGQREQSGKDLEWPEVKSISDDDGPVSSCSTFSLDNHLPAESYAQFPSETRHITEAIQPWIRKHISVSKMEAVVLKRKSLVQPFVHSLVDCQPVIGKLLQSLSMDSISVVNSAILLHIPDSENSDPPPAAQGEFGMRLHQKLFICHKAFLHGYQGNQGCITGCGGKDLKPAVGQDAYQRPQIFERVRIFQVTPMKSKSATISIPAMRCSSASKNGLAVQLRQFSAQRLSLACPCRTRGVSAQLPQGADYFRGLYSSLTRTVGRHDTSSSILSSRSSRISVRR